MYVAERLQRPLRTAMPAPSLDKAASRRTEPGFVDELRGDDGTRVLVVRGTRVAMAGGSILLRSPAQTLAAEREAGAGVWAYLGQDGPHAVLALLIPGPETSDGGAVPAPGIAVTDGGVEWWGLRQILEGPSGADLAVAAVALAAWHRGNERCPRCGAPTEVTTAGWQRLCPRDGLDLYPRQDPAVIMTVVDPTDTRVLLGHVSTWPERRFSTLAGFVEAGETLEDAVRREVAEEVNVQIGDVVYRGSQPWPFPASLMLGFEAQALTDEIRVDGTEISAARWLERDQLADEVASGGIELPSRASIARALIEDWYGGRLGE